MLSRGVSARAARAIVVPGAPIQSSKRYASEKAIQSRMEAVTNIQKVTKAMKMVASAKVRRCEENLKLSRNFSEGILSLWGADLPLKDANGVEIPMPAANTPVAADTPVEGAKPVIPDSVLVVPITPDRGLCGSVSAQVNRLTKKRVTELVEKGKKVQLVVYGEKARSTLERSFVPYMSSSATEHSKLKRRTFKQSCLMAEQFLRVPYENAEVVFNEFQNMMTFNNKHVRLLTYAQATADPKMFEAYELEGNSDTLENLYEFTMAVRMHRWMAESDMVEFSQRVNAMGNSSKSAEDVLARLKLLYNRTRQGRITTELVEIISGATAADDQALED